MWMAVFEHSNTQGYEASKLIQCVGGNKVSQSVTCRRCSGIGYDRALCPGESWHRASEPHSPAK